MAQRRRTGSFDASPSSQMFAGHMGSIPANAADQDSPYSRFNSGLKEADSLEDIADHMGEDFGFGFDPDEGDPNKPPSQPPVPTEVTADRTATSVSFTFPPCKCLDSLVIQILPAELALNPADPFAAFSLRKDIGTPNQTTQVVVSELRTASAYCFRLVARNSRGTVAGKPTAPITTLEYAPSRGDLSSYLFLYPVREVDKKSRRMSIQSIKAKGIKRDYVWVVLDGQLLAWADSVDGKELGWFIADGCRRLLVKEIRSIVSEDSMAESCRIIIQDMKGREFNFEADSRDPKISSSELCRLWLSRLRQLLSMAEGDFGKASNTALLL